MADHQKIDFKTELEIKCLIADSAVCIYRQILRDRFGLFGLDINCPYRKVLRSEFEKYEREKYNDAIDHIYDGH